jgi:hypothetical protein
MSTWYGNSLADELTSSGYEYDSIQEKLDAMTETELESDFAHRLMDRASQIREQWRNGTASPTW